MIMHRWLSSFACVLILASCSGSDSLEDDTETESTASASAVGALAGGNVTGSARSELEDDAPRATCTVRRCSAIAFSACASKVKSKKFSTDGANDCPCVQRNTGSLFNPDSDNGLRRVFGIVTLTFSADSCALSTAGDTVTRTLSNFHYRRGRKGRKIIYYTTTGTVGGVAVTDAELKDFEGNAHFGGGTLKKDSDSDSYDELTINGIHRAGFTPNAASFSERKMFQTVFTDTGALIKITRDTTNHKATLAAGSKWTVMRNLVKKREDWEVTENLVFSYDECDHPLQGVAKVTMNGESRTVTYTGKSCDDFDALED